IEFTRSSSKIFKNSATSSLRHHLMRRSSPPGAKKSPFVNENGTFVKRFGIFVWCEAVGVSLQGAIVHRMIIKQ
ncbi:MAG: hypothetical protein MJZ18_11210, partial [Bacteroidales bacterium]|nr:hypothetical protein [Bacteroidales bacterium]